MKRRVYVVNISCHDLSAAEKFGELVPMSKGLYSQLATGKMFRDFSAALRDSSPTDYIIPCGRRIMSVVACSIFTQMHGRLNLLLYQQPKEGGNRLDGIYKVREIVYDTGRNKEKD